MRDVAIYGAGYNTKHHIKDICKNFNIQYILDSNPQKANSELYGIQIKNPDKDSVCKYVVLIMINDVESAVTTLKKYGYSNEILWGCCYPDGVRIITYGTTKDINIFLETEKNKIIYTDDYIIECSEVNCNNSLPRVFNMSSSGLFYDPGGPCACLRNIHLANEEFKEIRNLFTLCPDRIIEPRNSFKKRNCKSQMNNEVLLQKKLLAVLFPTKEVSWDAQAIWYAFYYFSITDFLLSMYGRYIFDKSDLFILQDPDIAWVFSIIWPEYCHNVIQAYHKQGSLRSERQKTAAGLGDIFDHIQNSTMECIKYMIFPSYGAYEGFTKCLVGQTLTNAKLCRSRIVYNGYEKKELLYSDEDFAECMELLKDDYVIFSSATHLYVNKGVERIPYILCKIKEMTGWRIKWILIGNGEMQNEVNDAIEKWLLPEDYIWYKNRFDNQDNVFELFSHSDFYIMMHKISVFDLSTLQAMSYGCIPILSDVGGNKEFCAYDNGILVDLDNLADSLYKEILKYKDKSQLAMKKQKNQMIVKEKFNNKCFLEGYKKALEDLTEI